MAAASPVPAPPDNPEEPVTQEQVSRPPWKLPTVAFRDVQELPRLLVSKMESPPSYGRSQKSSSTTATLRATSNLDDAVVRQGLTRCRSAASAALRLCSTSSWRRARVLAALFVLASGWTVVYVDLLHGEATRSAWQRGFRVAELVSTALIGLRALEGGALLGLGAAAYGRVFARHWLFLISFAGDVALLFLLLAECERHDDAIMLRAVPVLAAALLLAEPAVAAARHSFAGTEMCLRRTGLWLQQVLEAIKQGPALSAAERQTLSRVATEVDKVGEPGQEWDASDLRLFLRASEAALTSGEHGLPWVTTDTLMRGVVDRIGATARDENYGILATLRSGVRHMLAGSRLHFALFCLASLMDACVSPLQAWLLSRIVQSANSCKEKHATNGAKVFLLLYLTSYVAGLCTYTVLVWAYSSLLAAATAKAQRRVAARMVAMSAKEHEDYPNGSINATFASDLTRMQDLWCGVTWSLIAPLTSVLVAMSYATFRHPDVGLLALTVFPFIFTTVPQSVSSRAAAAFSKANAETISVFQNGVMCQRMIWSFDKQSEWLYRYLEPRILEQHQKHLGMRLCGGTVQAYVQQLVNVFVALHVAILGWLALDGHMEVSELVGFISLFTALSSPSISLGGFYRVAVTCAGSAQRVDAFLEKLGRDRSRRDRHSKRLLAMLGVHRARLSPQELGPSPVTMRRTGMGDLEVTDLSFKYPGAAQLQLRSVSFRINAGEFAAVIGESGCGKSTLLALLMTWLQPLEGVVRLGSSVELNPGSADREDVARRLRARTAVVFQETMLINGTVHENIGIGVPGGRASREQVEWAAEAAGCAAFIREKLPDGFDTLLGGAGCAALSGGQAQRICIARALCRKPKLLLLDEATSALDPETEHQIIGTISGLRSTHPDEFGSLIVLSITHHPNTLCFADVVIRMADGGIADIRHTGAEQV